jgi:hypothetical protein
MESRRSPRHTVRGLSVLVVGVLGLSIGLSGAVATHNATHYPTITGGTWVRGPNLTDAAGRPQPRQEHAAVQLNGFVYLIGGFVPIQPPPQPTEEEPEPFPFEGTGEVLVYAPRGHPTTPDAEEGKWRSLPASSSFPRSSMHHIIATRHKGQVWTFGGHAGPFAPTRFVFRFTTATKSAAEGTWSRVRVSDGRACGRGDRCVRLPAPRAAGSAVSVGNRIYVLGGVVPYRKSPDPVNQSIRTTNSVIFLDTTRFPLRWRRAPSLLQRREHFNAVLVGGRIWVFHGRSEASTHMRGVESFAPGESRWRREQNAPVGTSANILGAVRSCVYSFGGEFIASNITGTLIGSQVFDAARRSWSRLRTNTAAEAAGADSKHGTFGVVYRENGVNKIMAPGGAATAWFDPTSKVHIFTPPPRCRSAVAGAAAGGRLAGQR